MLRLRHAAGLMAGACGLLLAAQPMAAQAISSASTQTPPPATAPAAPKPAPVYVPTSLAVDANVPRTPDGRPDFQGAVWHANFFTYLGAAAGPALVVPKERAKEVSAKIIGPFFSNPLFKIELPPDPMPESIPLVRGEYRSRLLVNPPDGKVPFTDAARKELAAPMALAQKADNPEERSYLERCLFADEPAPKANMITLGAREFIQTREHFVIHTGGNDEAVIIPMASAGRHTTQSYQNGWAVAHWEGDTLVVETTGMSEVARRRFLPSFIVNADAKVIERYTRVSKDELLYQFTVEDPKVYSAPWLAEYSLYRAPYRMYASNCHEGNYSMSNILRGQRVIDERAAAKRQAE